MLDKELAEVSNRIEQGNKRTSLMIKLCWIAVVLLNIALIWSAMK